MWILVTIGQDMLALGPRVPYNAHVDLTEFTDTQVLVLADGKNQSAVNNNRGHLFERFAARLLERMGYVEPSVENLNVTADGIELDVVVRHRLNGRLALAECKAYSSEIRAREFASFYGTLNGQRRLREEDIDGFFFALPRLNRSGSEQARKIENKDPGLRYLDVQDVVSAALEIGLISAPPDDLADCQLSDEAIVISEYGVFSAAKIVDPATGKAVEVVLWSRTKIVPDSVIRLVVQSDYAGGLPVLKAERESNPTRLSLHSGAEEEFILEVTGSRSDFEYQLPASPQYFVGRRRLVTEVEQVIDDAPSVLVLNAQSGWGKSSLALKMKQTISRQGGYAAVFDTRTASHITYVASALRDAATKADRAKFFKLPDSALWTSLNSALDTIDRAQWRPDAGPLMIFFDQFENVFRDESLTREFRNLAFKVRDIGRPIVIGFAWKTDLVAWAENYPFRLRDEIRDQAHRVSLPPMGPDEVNVLLSRLQKNLGQKLAYDLRERLREYSQGLPWLFKKLAGHVLQEVRAGVTQSELVSGALNIQNLFESDLAELHLDEREGLVHIARYAPVPASEVQDRVPASVINSLLHRRLIVQVGERLDTYWDTFRDFLVNGRVPIEDSYILRQHPSSVGRMIRELLQMEGDATVSSLSERLSNSEKVIYNLARDLRGFGILAHEPNRVRLVDDIRFARDRENALRERVSISLRRHRAFSMLNSLIERAGGETTLADFAEILPGAFPAVAAAPKSWRNYARAFTLWFDSSGLVYFDGQKIQSASHRNSSEVSLFSESAPSSHHRTTGAFPDHAPGPAMKLLITLAGNPSYIVATKAEKRALATLRRIKAVQHFIDGSALVITPGLVESDGRVAAPKLRQLVEQIPGAERALRMLEDSDPHASYSAVGQVLRDAQGTSWSPSTTELVGKHFRSWAKYCGVAVRRARNMSDAQDRIF